MRKKLLGKNVLVTGAGRGLGAALCKQFGKEGAYIIGCDIDPKNLDLLSSELENLGVDHHLSVCDIARENSVKAFFKGIAALGKEIDILINNAGITNIKLFKNNTNEEIKRVMDINFMGSVYCTREGLNQIIKNKGSIVAISSVAGFAPLVGRTAYAASKHAVQGFFETLRSEIKHTGANVLIVCPSYIDTNIRSHMYKNGENNSNTDHKIGGNASPEKVAEEIYKATLQRKDILITGSVGRVSFMLKRLVPHIYEKVMMKNLSKGFDF